MMTAKISYLTSYPIPTSPRLITDKLFNNINLNFMLLI